MGIMQMPYKSAGDCKKNETLVLMRFDQSPITNHSSHVTRLSSLVPKTHGNYKAHISLLHRRAFFRGSRRAGAWKEKEKKKNKCGGASSIQI